MGDAAAGRLGGASAIPESSRVPLHVLLVLPLYALLPLLAAWWFCRLYRRHGGWPGWPGRFAALLAGAILSFPVTMVVWILGCLLIGLLVGILSGDLDGHLRGAMRLAVPLTRDKAVLPWGLWPPLAVWLVVVGLAGRLLERRWRRRA